MSTEFIISSSKSLDLWTFFANMGYTVDKHRESASEYRVVLGETLTDAQKAEVTTGITLLKERVQVDLGYSGEPEAHAKARYKEVVSQCSQYQILTEGFVHATKIFSLSALSQISWLGLFVSKDLMTYPYVIPVMDDTETYSIADAAEVTTMWIAVLTKVATVRSEGTAKKVEIEDAAGAVAARAVAVGYLTSKGCTNMISLLGP
jgi:hypothetical protein